MTWIFFALGSALFAALQSIPAKAGMKHIDSTAATALRTTVILLFAWLMVWITGQSAPPHISVKSYLFLALSGVATGASWLCYYHALHLGTVNKVTAVDKSSTVLSMLLAFAVLREPLSANMIVGMIAIAGGTVLMLKKGKREQSAADGQSGAENRKWFAYAALSAVFAALTSILAKYGIENVPSNYATAFRTGIVLVMAWLVVFIQKKQTALKNVRKKDIVFIALSGIAGGASWLCYYRALQSGPASVVVPIDKLSILGTALFARIFFHEKLNPYQKTGLVLITAGTLVLLVHF
ncbi:EamA family transporter [Treponema brennaborense]|uniref:EamA domain-containing protein n=1 Tax=Treponema brennaborense (strain DSM 12168 / CIP 105900 / DD5/3) TaxID=906968 RepID=F4LQH4_TREBD|nr:protein of unknown function DUF6 transmembrane [Treponema brennaborense DSM 12168]